MGGESKDPDPATIPSPNDTIAESAQRTSLESALRLGDVRTFNSLRRQMGFQRLTFTEIDLTRATLSLAELNLSNCEFENVDFVGLNLTNVLFAGSEFRGCVFRSCDLSGANFYSATFTASRAPMTGANPRASEFRAVQAWGVNFQKVTFKDVVFRDSVFRGCNFMDTKFLGVRLSDTSLPASAFQGAVTDQLVAPEGIVSALTPEQRGQIQRYLSPGDRFRAAAERAKEHERDPVATPDPDLDSLPSAPPSLPVPIEPTTLTTTSEGDTTMAQPQAPSSSLQDRAIASAKNALGISLSEAEEGLFRAACETVVEVGRDALVKLIDEIAPLSPESRAKLVAFLGTDVGKGVTGAVLSGIFASPLMNMLPGVSPKAIEFIQNRMAAEIRKGTVYKPAAKTGIKLVLMGPLKGVFDAVTGFTNIIEARMSADEERGEPKGLGEPHQMFDAFTSQPAPVNASPGTGEPTSK